MRSKIASHPPPNLSINALLSYRKTKHANCPAVKEPPYLSLLSGFSKAIVVIQMSWRFPLLSPLKYIFLLFTTMRPHSHIRGHSREQLERRIRRKGAVEHLDFFEQIVPKNREPPQDRNEMRHLEQVAGQLLVAGYEPPALWLYFSIYYLIKNPNTQQILAKEIRDSFQLYSDITSETAAPLPYLAAFLKETLRLMPGVLTGMPVVSPGAMVDGKFIAKGVGNCHILFFQAQALTFGESIRLFVSLAASH